MLIMRNRLALALIGLVVAAALAAGAQTRSAAKPRELTALDYIEIQQLVAKYARAIDTCSNNGYDYADLFTPDGAFIPSFNGKPGTPFQGRERLAEASGGGSKNCRNVGWIEQGVHHLYANHIITPTVEGATGTVDMLMIGLGGDPNKLYFAAGINDEQGGLFGSLEPTTSAAIPLPNFIFVTPAVLALAGYAATRKSAAR